MFVNDFTAVANGAVGKVGKLRSDPLAYFLLSMLAGAYIGFGVLLAFTLGGSMAGSPGMKLTMGASFGVALSLVVMAGGELFTGNNLAMAAGMLKKKVSLADSVLLWIVCWLGNWAGAIVLSLLYYATGLYTDATLVSITGAAAVKMTAGPLALLTRGMLCNMLVCIAVWCAAKLKSEAAKLIMIFWCLLAFFTTGFEHSIANMTTLTMSLLDNGGNAAITVGGYFYNLGIVTVGNMIGGILLVAIPYYMAGRKSAE